MRHVVLVVRVVFFATRSPLVALWAHVAPYRIIYVFIYGGTNDIILDNRGAMQPFISLRKVSIIMKYVSDATMNKQYRAVKRKTVC